MPGRERVALRKLLRGCRWVGTALDSVAGIRCIGGGFLRRLHSRRLKDMHVVQSLTNERKKVTPTDGREPLIKQHTCMLAATIATLSIGKDPTTGDLEYLRKMLI